MKKILNILFTSLLIIFTINLYASSIYDVDYDDDNIIVKAEKGYLIIENKTKYLLVIDNIKKNKKMIKNFLTIKNCNYIKMGNMVDVDYSGNNMQIFSISMVLKPGEKKKIKIKYKKGDILRVELYVANYNFFSDNVYLPSKIISDTEIEYKLFKKDKIKRMKNLKGIMVYVSEYNFLIDNYEHPKIKIR